MSIDKGSVLLRLARAEISSALGKPQSVNVDVPWLLEKAATFVTLTQAGNLRGCIGTLEAHRTLREDVKANARAAAFRDPRFPPLQIEELARTRVEVSLLTAPMRMAFESEEHALTQLRPDVDGLILEYGYHRGTFLPQVWEQLPDPGDFLAHLKRKAGLPADFWAPEIRLSRYSVSKWKEPEREVDAA